MADNSDLKAQLERKKQRLAQIREEKKRKQEEKKRKQEEKKRKQEEKKRKQEEKKEDRDLDRKRRETEALLQSIGISPEPPLGTHTAHLPRTPTRYTHCTFPQNPY
uniref:Uncharacterized protein n=1 Tax=Oncorhynchus tshawytscha TaxID=74940 RepID=A0AAZ3NZC0_ONCTS